ncbi:hypothetical protein MNBD_GAMMA15-840 [hydrothermal vent metagenome]|uniref:Lipoprotein n=1 Tax=hydrothermal vent metagenome TaxID=652676 RepID=A0A3B0YKH1_9ZZZZ
MRIYPIYIVLLVIWFSGCTTVNTFPITARRGDTITVPVGSPDSMSKANTVITYVPDDGSPSVVLHDTVAGTTGNFRALINLYPEKTSAAWLDNFEIQNMADATVHGVWLTVILLDLPMTVPTGQGELQINSSAVYPGNSFIPHINNTPVRLEILSGDGSPNTFDFYKKNFFQTAIDILPGNIAELESKPRLIVSPPRSSITSNPKYAAAELVINIPGITGSSNSLKVIADELPESVISRRQMDWKLKGDNLSIYFLSSQGLLEYMEMRISVLGLPLASFSGATVSSLSLYDINGNLVAPPTELGDLLSWKIEQYDVNGS